MNMRLLGARNLKEIVPEMVDASNIHLHTVAVPTDSLYDTNCACWFTPSQLFFRSSLPFYRRTSPGRTDQGDKE